MALEPYLVPSFQETESHKIFIKKFLFKNLSLGLLTFFFDTNIQKSPPRNQYARIDIVVVPKDHRKLGVGKALVYLSLLEILNSYGNNVYNISCLAGHVGISNILSGVGFETEKRADEDFVRCTKLINEDVQDDYKRELEERIIKELKTLNYKLIQND